MFFLNAFLQMTPCYSKPENAMYKIAFFVGIVVITVFLAVHWTFVVASSEELARYFLPIYGGFISLGIGFYFFMSHFPESVFRNNRFVQIYL